MEPQGTPTTDDPTIAEACRGVERQLMLLDERRRQGLPTGTIEEALRALWIDLGLAYAREAVRVAELRHRVAGPE
ncbi:hypothetical protein [Methylobacterium nonmethylotrophicum]|uniref:Uncharacterized protein n=1 Tax=Methylobacterium nonmethylotrophicum TaxID=1141884 RepID=A0A4Z0NMK0_9HYPH|nr:hypothetical protein [Methylobacterium nonmethylotrophicum]TGD96797.1 hypothetical protein EU555_22360 [Methylobacterium nonmethylotrophicum]